MAKKKIIISDFNERNGKSLVKNKNNLVKKIILAVLIVAVLAFVIVQIVNASTNYIGKVGDKKIYVWEYQANLSSIEYEMTQELSDEVEIEAFWNQVVDGKTNRQIAKEEALKRSKEQKVKMLEAEERDIFLDNTQLKDVIKNADAEIDYAINQYASQYGMEFTREEYVESAYGVDYTQYKEQRANDWIVNKLDTLEKSKIVPTDAEIKSWYEENKEDYDLYNTSRIFISLQDEEAALLTGEELTKKQDAITAVQTKLDAGEKVSAIAGQYTEKTSEVNGAYNFKKGKADVEEINTWMETAKEGDYTKIEVKDKDDKVTGVYFIQYDGMTTMDTPESEDARNIETTVKGEVIVDKYNKLVEGWMADSKYDVKLNQGVYDKVKVSGMLVK